MQLFRFCGGIVGGDFLTERTAKETVIQAVEDFDSIKRAIEGHKIDVPYATKTSEYAELIAKITVRPIAGNVIGFCKSFDTEIVCGSVNHILTGHLRRAIVGSAVSVPDDD